MKKSIRNLLIAGLVTVSATAAFSTSAFAGKKERVRNTIIGLGVLGLLHHNAHKHDHDHGHYSHYRHDNGYHGYYGPRRVVTEEYVESYPEVVEEEYTDE